MHCYIRYNFLVLTTLAWKFTIHVILIFYFNKFSVEKLNGTIHFINQREILLVL
jgi:hypothetical protein